MKLLKIEDCITTKPAPIDFVIPGLPRGVVGALVSPGGTGKSMFALELAMSIASDGNANLLGFPIKSGKVLYLAGEDPEPILHDRIYNIGAKLDLLARSKMAENLLVAPLLGTSPRLTSEDWIKEVIKTVDTAHIGTKQPLVLIVIDTLSKFHELDENDNGKMSKLLGVMDTLAQKSGAAVLFLHHVSKGAVFGGNQDMQQAARGASSILDNARYGIALIKMDKDEATKYGVPEIQRGRYVKYMATKANYGGIDLEVPTWLVRGANGVLSPASLTEVK